MIIWYVLYCILSRQHMNMKDFMYVLHRMWWCFDQFENFTNVTINPYNVGTILTNGSHWLYNYNYILVVQHTYTSIIGVSEDNPATTFFTEYCINSNKDCSITRLTATLEDYGYFSSLKKCSICSGEIYWPQSLRPDKASVVCFNGPLKRTYYAEQTTLSLTENCTNRL